MSTADLAAARAQAYAAQRQVVTVEPSFATMACPGSGKTRVIVDRHLSRPVPERQGRAITSFTRVAATEIHRRCVSAGRLDLTDHPHFLGTLDTFLWLHLVRPFLPPDRPWRRLDSWRDAPTKSAQFVCGQTHHLDGADIEYDPRTDGWRIRPKSRTAQGQLPASWDSQVRHTRAALERAGYLTGAELRAHACRNLARRPMLGALLSVKYAELVVDEAQDCSTADLHILDSLHNAGLPLVIVADPDQAIYGFRGAATEELATLATRLGRHDLTHNWRSTSTICTVAATLRDPARRIPDTAVADHHGAPHPVLVYTGRDRDAITTDFIAYAAELDINAGNCLVLAHAQAILPKTYTGAAKPPSSGAGALAWAIGIITEYPTAPTRVRNRANDILARTVLRWWYTEADNHTPAQTLVAYDVDPAEFEWLLHRVATAMPSLDQPMRTWVPAAVTVLNQHPPPGATVRTRNRLICSRSHADRAARTVTSLPSAPAAGARPRLSTVHQIKGDQADAVLLHVPPCTRSDLTMTAWVTGTVPNQEVAESLRVLYVGVTRARHLLGLAVPHTDRDRLLAHLDGYGVRTELR